jgi:RNA polymerase sigma-70 factor, ECF subfamily
VVQANVEALPRLSGVAAGRDEAASRAAFMALLGPALDPAYRLAGVILGSAVEAEDAVQDASLLAWRGFGGLRSPERFEAWFGRILVNLCRDRVRRGRVVTFVTLPEGFERGAWGAAVATDATAGAADRIALAGALDRLDADHRIAIVLRYWADLPVEEIAERTGTRPGTVKSRIHHGLRRLRAALDGEG